MSVHVHVGRLVLDGLDLERRDLPRVESAFRRELGRLIRVQGVPERLLKGGAVPSLSADLGLVPRRHGAAAFGARLARRVYGDALGGGGRTE